MFRIILLLVAVAAFCTGVFFLWKLLVAKNIPSGLGATVQIGARTYEVEVAQTLTQKSTGLARRDSLAAGYGMIFPFESKKMLAFTMQGMRFSLDIIWIADGKIVDMAKNLKPDTGMVASAYRSAIPVDMVLELNGGVSEADGLKVGDSVQISYKK